MRRLCRAAASICVLACAVSLPGCVLDFSPDGRQIVYPWSSGLSIDGIDGATRQPVADSAHGWTASWSPNGRYILFAEDTEGKTEVKLYSTAAKTTRSIGGNMNAPFAWREDGGWFACIHDLGGSYEIIFYSVLESGIAQRTPISFKPDVSHAMVWLPGTNDVALLGADGNVYTVEAGETHKITTSNDVIGLSLAPGHHALRWAQRGPNLKYILLSIFDWDLTARSAKRVPIPDRVPPINPDPRHAPEGLASAQFSPDGSHLGLLATYHPASAGRTPTGAYTALWVMGLDGRNARLVQKAQPSTITPDTAAPLARARVDAGILAYGWSHDGRELGLLHVRGNAATLLIGDGGGSAMRTLRSEPQK